MKKIQNQTKLKYKNIIITVIFLFVFSFMTIGYARYNQLLSFNGLIKIPRFGNIFISNITLTDSENATENNPPVISDTNIYFDVNFSGEEEEFFITYLVEITNDSVVDFTYVNNSFAPTIVSSTGSRADCELIIDGIEDGEVIPKGEVVAFTATLKLTPEDPNASYDVTGETEIEAAKEEVSYMLGTIEGTTTGNLRGSNTLAPFKIKVTNTYAYDRQFSIKPSGSNFSICDNNGNALNQLTVHANSEEEFNFYIKQNENASLPNDTETLGLTLKSSGVPNISLGNVTLLVDINYVPDYDAPVISDVTVTKSKTEGTIELSWESEDISSVTTYYIVTHNVTRGTTNTIETNSSNTYYTIDSLTDGEYYFVVYGIDSLGNTATTEQINSATNSSGAASRCVQQEIKWNYTVTFDLTRLGHTGESTVKYGANYTCKLSENTNNYALPTSITVKMDGTSNPSYTYTQNNGNITINNVTGNITITAEGRYNGCLAKGTKILMADYTYKNIEDVRYDDLVLVWNYETGKFVKEYPVWLKKEKVAYEYQLTTLEDGSYLKSVGDHGVFNSDINEFVTIFDLKPGDNIVKLEDNEFKSVKVVSVETIHEKINYYDVISTRYYNVIANDILTTDGVVIFSNLYGFNDNITFKEKNNNRVYQYEEIDNAVPYYMFLGLRVYEGKVLENILPLENFKYHLHQYQGNMANLLQPITKCGERYWMVTTSNDIVNDFNKSKYLVKEGSKYKLPVGVKSWYSHGNNKYYKPGEEVTIWYGNYFEAIY